MSYIGQLQNTLPVGYSGLPEMSLVAIGESENPPKYPQLTYCTIHQRHHWDLWCLPKLMCNMQAALYEPSILLKHIAICIIQQVLDVAGSVLVYWRSMRCALSFVIATNDFSFARSIASSDGMSKAVQCVSSRAPYHLNFVVCCLNSMHWIHHCQLKCLYAIPLLHSIILVIFRWSCEQIHCLITADNKCLESQHSCHLKLRFNSSIHPNSLAHTVICPAPIQHNTTPRTPLTVGVLAITWSCCSWW